MPDGDGPFLAIPDPSRPWRAELGLWNVFANANDPAPYPMPRDALCAQLAAGSCTDDALLATTLAAFKTPSLRDLGHSAPFMHSCALDTLDDAVLHYHQMSQLARAGSARNIDPRLGGVRLHDSD